MGGNIIHWTPLLGEEFYLSTGDLVRMFWPGGYYLFKNCIVCLSKCEYVAMKSNKR